MANKTISGLTTISSVDPAVDVIEISDISAGSSNKVTRNGFLGITSTPVGINDSQTLTNKTITSPTISGPTLSGTLTGTYTLGGTPTFPSSVVTLTGSQTLTNKILTSPTINTATIVNPTITADSIAGFTTSNTGTIYGITVTTGTIGTAAIANSAVTYQKVASGFPVQIVSTNFSAVATGTTAIPRDDTIPQITEGTEFMTQAITPKSSTNILVIESDAYCANSAVCTITGALFQDAATDALAIGVHPVPDAAALAVPGKIIIKYRMTAGTTSSITFRVRIGTNGGGTLTFNGASSAREFGTATKSSITITEYTP